MVDFRSMRRARSEPEQTTQADDGRGYDGRSTHGADDRQRGRGGYEVQEIYRGRNEEASSRDRGGRDSGDRSSRDSGDRGSDRSLRGGSKGFVYTPRSSEDVSARANQSSKDFDTYLKSDVKIWKPNDGANTIRVLPPTWDKPKHYGIDLFVHFGVGPDEQAYLCLFKMKGEACPLCDALQQERGGRGKGRDEEQYLKDLEPTKRVLFYLIDRDHEKEGVQAWAAPWTIDRDTTKVSVDRRTGDVLPIDDPQNGYDLEFDRTGKGINTKYVGLAISRRSSPLGDNRWLDYAIENPLPSILEYYSYEHIEQVFGGGSGRSAPVGQARDDRGSDSGRGSVRDDSRASGRNDRGRDDTTREQRGAAITFDAVRKMHGDVLDRFIASMDLRLSPNNYSSDEELQDAVCKELDLSDDDGSQDRLRQMREQSSSRR
jgi:hypothetical protein